MPASKAGMAVGHLDKVVREENKIGFLTTREGGVVVGTCRWVWDKCEDKCVFTHLMNI